MTILGLIFTAFAATGAISLTGGMVDCVHLKVQEVDFSKCSYTDATEILDNGKFIKSPACWAKFSYGPQTKTLHMIDQPGQVNCSSNSLNAYCLSPEERIVVNTPPCSGKTISENCTIRVQPKITHIPGNSYYDSRYQCSCQNAGCGQVIHAFKNNYRKPPTLEELHAAVQRAIPGCDDISIQNVTPSAVKDEVRYALSSLKCPLLQPSFVSEYSCPKGFQAARRLFVGEQCSNSGIFAIACVPELSMVRDSADPCLTGNP